eukprot:CAMPEP_0206325432 /NCGR_PEP_ID=MMETSP0106_2-20121207/21074_1 /ASSEMBLY_ACC=CAM_ASM_000206 /TAXON_ID=81532 /ORGANISM="Acanthoeca-like sp., Strain 10tr" /LENGTH=30 /DNA_ID= /DNA_START= /DNA_END= /DNA_ORIENTATION=
MATATTMPKETSRNDNVTDLGKKVRRPKSL